MSQVVLLRADQNPHGRTLVQDGVNMHVLTGCCEAKFDSFVDDDGRVWTQCSNCLTHLDLNPDGWSSDVDNLHQWTEYAPSGLGEWAKFWFGLEDFKMVVTIP